MGIIFAALAIWSGFISYEAYHAGYNAKSREIVAIARKLTVNRAHYLEQLDAANRIRHQRSLTLEQERELRLRIAISTIDQYPGLKKCVIPAEVVQAVDEVANP